VAMARGRSSAPSMTMPNEESDTLTEYNAMRSMVSGMIAGAIGGLAGTLAMNYAQRAWTLAAGERPPASAAGKHDARDWQERSEHQNSNELAAQAVADVTIDRRLTRAELSIASRLVHFGFGAAAGAIYGAFLETDRRRPAGGVAFGTSVWLAADEIAMPLIGLSRSTLERPGEMHLQSYAAHLVYGVVTERVRQGVRSLLTP
jgi:putative membrane protein